MEYIEARLWGYIEKVLAAGREPMLLDIKIALRRDQNAPGPLTRDYLVKQLNLLDGTVKRPANRPKKRVSIGFHPACWPEMRLAMEKLDKESRELALLMEVFGTAKQLHGNFSDKAIQDALAATAARGNRSENTQRRYFTNALRQTIERGLWDGNSLGDLGARLEASLTPF